LTQISAKKPKDFILYNVGSSVTPNLVWNFSTLLMRQRLKFDSINSLGELVLFKPTDPTEIN
jgi:hypothetical protein